MGKSVLIALAVVGAVLFTAGPATAATRPITFSLLLGSGSVYGAATDNATVTLRWKDSAGRLKAQGEVTASGWGSWSFSAPPGVVVEQGDRLTASDGHRTHKLTVPRLTAIANRVKNVFKGTAPPGSRLSIECFYPGAPVPDVACERVKLTVNDDGRWSHRPGWDVQGGDGVQLRWRSPEGDEIWFSAEAPFVVVTIGSAQVSGKARQSSTATVSLKEASSGELLASWSGQIGLRLQTFTGTLRDPSGNRFFVASGQLLVSNIASDARFVVPRSKRRATSQRTPSTVAARTRDGQRIRSTSRCTGLACGAGSRSPKPRRTGRSRKT